MPESCKACAGCRAVRLCFDVGRTVAYVVDDSRIGTALLQVMQSVSYTLRPNQAKRKLKAGMPALCAGGIDDPDLIEQIGAAGLVDVAWMDMEHGRWSWGDIATFSRACDLWGITSQVRVQYRGDIGRALDQGAQSIIVPHVLSLADAEDAVERTYYAPIGSRGVALSRQSYGTVDYFRSANDEVMLGLIIEDIEAIECLSDIIRVEGVDYFFVAPGDLSQSMGPAYLGKPDHPDVRALVARTIETIVAADRVAGTLVDEATLTKYLELGARFLLYNPFTYLFDGARRFRDSVSLFNSSR